MAKHESNFGRFRVVLRTATPTGRELERFRSAVLRHPKVRNLFRASARLLTVRPLLPEKRASGKFEPGNVEATIVDYAANRTLFVRGSPDDLRRLEIDERGVQPLPSREEFEAAVKVLRADEEFGPLLERGAVTPFRPMPPLLDGRDEQGRLLRVLGVGLRSKEGGRKYRMIGVNMHDHAITPALGYELPVAGDCGAPEGASCDSTGSISPMWLDSYDADGDLVWSLLIVGPALSSGTMGSGIELRYVNYRGRRVLFQAHAPILNVHYHNAQRVYDHDVNEYYYPCGPTYRDWVNEEACFEATGTLDPSGVMLCTAPSRTVFENGVSGGTFRGVALHVAGSELVLRSELEAGWYRYLSEWRLDEDGAIRPRFGFAAVENACTCEAHSHHVYWRFDFDVDTSSNNRVEELAGGVPTALSYETKKENRDQDRGWSVVNSDSGRGWFIVPGPHDGTADEYGVGDLWALRYHPGEIDDGQGPTTNWFESRIDIDRFCNGEPIVDRDVVVWYGGHFAHEPGHVGGEILGPDLVPNCAVVITAVELGIARERLDLLRRLRAELAKSEAGQRWLRLWYACQDPIWKLLKNKKAKRQAAQVIEAVAELAASPERAISDDLVSEARDLLRSLEGLARGRLRQRLKRAAKELSGISGRTLSRAMHG